MTVTVGPNKKRGQARVHRIIAECFIPNPYGLPEVNHIDCNRKNNNASNLEWVSHTDNIRHSYDMGNYKGRFGEMNPNYNNRTLHLKYLNDPELSKEKNSRPGTNNGRCVKISLRNKYTGEALVFDYIGAAAQYLIDNGYSTGTVNSVRDTVRRSLNNGTLCYGTFIVSRVDK